MTKIIRIHYLPLFIVFFIMSLGDFYILFINGSIKQLLFHNNHIMGIITFLIILLVIPTITVITSNMLRVDTTKNKILLIKFLFLYQKNYSTYQISDHVWCYNNRGRSNVTIKFIDGNSISFSEGAFNLKDLFYYLQSNKHTYKDSYKDYRVI